MPRGRRNSRDSQVRWTAPQARRQSLRRPKETAKPCRALLAPIALCRRGLGDEPRPDRVHEFAARWRWKLGDVAFWDNRLSTRYATLAYLSHSRTRTRAAILGHRPR